MFGLKENDVESIQNVFSKFEDVEKVVLYGSRAKGNYRPASDIDLTIFGHLDLNTLHKIEWEIDDLLLPYKIDLSLHHQISNPYLLEHIDRIGVDFYSPVLK